MDNIIRRLDKGPEYGERVFVADNAVVIGDVELGDDSSVWYSVVIRGDVEKISIGKCSNVQDGSVIHVTKDTYPTVLKDFVTIGHSVTLHGCTIENNVLVGIGSVVMDDAVIGENSIVAAGSLVPPGKKYPAGSLIMGSPAKVVKELSAEDIKGIRDYADRYVMYKNIYLDRRK
ncbi:gamma carbonic anhydrase family protein [Limisalsivibrio acetivorans]|uniref:gamma carbonic anhydrase family protein n=1 Tax=Limisalsivibrio acetivorans TaxID=1304888 RepID=UPI0003B3ECDF|nr:gamma carbonic anhydrase family protein [Limisalsivibrio acetivorans]